MKHDSMAFETAHFNRKALRWKRALRACPTARLWEVEPFRMLMRAHTDEVLGRATLLDMMAGNGFLSRHLDLGLRRVVGADIAGSMLEDFPGEHICLSDEAQPPDVFERVQPDIIVSLAGMHHVYVEDDGRVLEEESQALQEKTLCGWLRAPSAPLVVLADVTENPAHERTAMSDGAHSVQAHFSAALLATPLPPAVRQLSGNQLTLDQYARTWRAELARPEIRSSQGVASWFHEVVTPHGELGHREHFLRPTRLMGAMRSQGLSACYLELPTPWVFRSVPEMLWFLNEKFLFAPTMDKSGIARTEIGRRIERWAHDYLGVRELPGGGLLLSWTLGFYFARAAVGEDR